MDFTPGKGSSTSADSRKSWVKLRKIKPCNSHLPGHAVYLLNLVTLLEVGLTLQPPLLSLSYHTSTFFSNIFACLIPSCPLLLRGPGLAKWAGGTMRADSTCKHHVSLQLAWSWEWDSPAAQSHRSGGSGATFPGSNLECSFQV